MGRLLSEYSCFQRFFIFLNECLQSITQSLFPFPSGDAPGSLDMGLVETCVGGSAVLPCLPVNHEGLAVEGVSLKRQQGQAPVEMLYHSQHQHGSTSSLSSTWLPPDRVQLSTEPGPRGIAYSLTLQQLQAEDSGLYSCQLLLHGRSETSSSLGRHVFFVSVKGGWKTKQDQRVTPYCGRWRLKPWWTADCGHMV